MLFGACHMVEKDGKYQEVCDKKLSPWTIVSIVFASLAVICMVIYLSIEVYQRREKAKSMAIANASSNNNGFYNYETNNGENEIKPQYPPTMPHHPLTMSMMGQVPPSSMQMYNGNPYGPNPFQQPSNTAYANNAHFTQQQQKEFDDHSSLSSSSTIVNNHPQALGSTANTGRYTTAAPLPSAAPSGAGFDRGFVEVPLPEKIISPPIHKVQ